MIVITGKGYCVYMHLSGIFTAPIYPPRMASRSWKIMWLVVFGAPPPIGLIRNNRHSMRIMKGAVKANLHIFIQIIVLIHRYHDLLPQTVLTVMAW